MFAIVFLSVEGQTAVERTCWFGDLDGNGGCVKGEDMGYTGEECLCQVNFCNGDMPASNGNGATTVSNRNDAKSLHGTMKYCFIVFVCLTLSNINI